MAEIKYAIGFFFNKKRDNAPSFVLGSMSISKEKAIKWLQEQEADSKGYIRLKINEGKEKPYVALDEWKPGQEKKEKDTIQYPSEEDDAIDLSNIPF